MRGVGRTKVGQVAATVVIASLVLTAPNVSWAGAASDTPPEPSLRMYVPSTAQVESEERIALAPGGPKQVVVTYVNEQPSKSELTSRDLLILTWDRFAKRWVTVFDAAKVNLTGQKGILPSTYEVSNLSYRAIRSAPHRTDLAFWADETAGANGSVVAAIVHYNGQTASLAWGRFIRSGE